MLSYVKDHIYWNHGFLFSIITNHKLVQHVNGGMSFLQMCNWWNSMFYNGVWFLLHGLVNGHLSPCQISNQWHSELINNASWAVFWMSEFFGTNDGSLICFAYNLIHYEKRKWKKINQKLANTNITIAHRYFILLRNISLLSSQNESFGVFPFSPSYNGSIVILLVWSSSPSLSKANSGASRRSWLSCVIHNSILSIQSLG